MIQEIERKFLLKNDDWRKFSKGTLYKQGYLSINDLNIIRVRTIGNQGILSVKERVVGISRMEYEYSIPLDEAERMLSAICQKPIIEKYRYKIPIKNLIWEVDEFIGENQGLIVAEVELEKENQRIELPDWIGEEVSHDVRYYNFNLIKHPFSKWKK